MAPTNQRELPRLLLIVVALLVIARVAFGEETIRQPIDAQTSIVATPVNAIDHSADVTLERGNRVIWRGIALEPVEKITVRDLAGDARPEVIIEYANRARNPVTGVYRYDGDSLRTIAEIANYWGFLTIDFDGDKRLELIETGCCGHAECATGIYTALLRYDGTRFVAMPMELTELSTFTTAGGERILSHGEGDYVAHVIVQGGRACGWIRDGGKNLIQVSGDARTHRRVHLDGSCHKLSFRGTIVGATTISLLLEKKGPGEVKHPSSPAWPTKHDTLRPDATRTAH